jgi:hypothetical protein
VYSTGIESLCITRKAGNFRLAVMGKPKLVHNKSILGRERSDSAASSSGDSISSHRSLKENYR